MVKPIFNNDQLIFIKENYNKMTYKEMSQKDLFQGFTDKQIRNRARTLGLSKTRKFNNDFFEEINTKEKAYYLGFIYADGYVVYNPSKANYELGIEIHQDDEEILHNLNKLLGNQHIITKREREITFNGYTYNSLVSSLRIYSKNLCENLIVNGIVCNKTNSNIYPTVKDELFFHFLRGFLDGDGCVYLNKNRVGIHFTNSNVNFLNHLKQKLHNYNINSTIYKEKDKKYRLNLSNADSMRVWSLLYDDSDNLKLERKYNKYVS